MVIKNKLFVLTSILVFAAGNSLAGDPGTAKWTLPFPTGGAVSGSPAVGPSGTIYITAEDGYLYAINPTNGQAAWPNPVYVDTTTVYADELISSPALAPDGTIYAASSGILYSVSANGTLNWSLHVGGGAGGAVAVASNGIVYVTCDDDPHLYAVKPSPDNSSGTVQWTLNLNADIGMAWLDSPPTVGPDGTIYLYGLVGQGGIFDEQLVAIEDESCAGGVKWTADLYFNEEDNDFHSTLVLDNAGRIYAPYGPGSTSLMAFSTVDGSPAWGNPFSPTTGASIQSSPAIAAGGTVYIGATDGRLYALNTNGTPKWSFDTHISDPAAAINSSPALASDATIVFGSDDGRLWCVKDNGASVTEQWTYPARGTNAALSGPIRSSPLIAGTDNTIYFGCGNTKAYAVYGSAPLASTPWPMFRRDAGRSGSAAPNVQPGQLWVSGVVGGPMNIYKGITGFGVPYSGTTWITLSRGSCTNSYSTNLMVTFLLGGILVNGEDTSSTPYYDYNPAYSYYQLDFTVTGCTKAPFPNGFYVTFQPGQTEITVGIQTVDSFDYGDVQALMFSIPSQPGFGANPEASRATINVYPDQNQ